MAPIGGDDDRGIERIAAKVDALPCCGTKRVVSCYRVSDDATVDGLWMCQECDFAGEGLADMLARTAGG